MGRLFAFYNHNTGEEMHPRERVLELIVLHQQRGEPIPLDLLARADALGLSLHICDQPLTQDFDEGDYTNVKNEDL